MGAVPTINTTLGACEGLDVLLPWSSRRGWSVQVNLIARWEAVWCGYARLLGSFSCPTVLVLRRLSPNLSLGSYWPVIALSLSLGRLHTTYLLCQSAARLALQEVPLTSLGLSRLLYCT